MADFSKTTNGLWFINPGTLKMPSWHELHLKETLDYISRWRSHVLFASPCADLFICILELLTSRTVTSKKQPTLWRQLVVCKSIQKWLICALEAQGDSKVNQAISIQLSAVEGHLTACVSTAQWICTWSLSPSPHPAQLPGLPSYLLLMTFGARDVHMLETKWGYELAVQDLPQMPPTSYPCEALQQGWRLRHRTCTWYFTSSPSSVWEYAEPTASFSPGSSCWCYLVHLWACSPHTGDRASVPLSFYASCWQKLPAVQTPEDLQPEIASKLVAPSTDMTAVGLFLGNESEVYRSLQGTQNSEWLVVLTTSEGQCNCVGLMEIKTKDKLWGKQGAWN